MTTVYIWSSGETKLADPIDPEKLGRIPSWSRDIDYYAPWIVCNDFKEVQSEICWYGQLSSGQPKIIVCGPCSSSNQVGWAFFYQGLLVPWDSVLAVSQWSGQGQLGRSWYSPEGNIYASLLMPKFKDKFSFFPSVFFGYLLVLALGSLKFQTWLKWPNDIIYQGKKSGGILIQEKREAALLGVGLNIFNLPTELLKEQQEKKPAPGCLNFTHHPDWGPIRWWSALVNQIIVCYEKMLLADKEVVRSSIEEYLAFTDQEVWVHSGYEQPYLVRIRGIDQTGRLQVLRNGRLESIQQGRIFIKLDGKK